MAVPNTQGGGRRDDGFTFVEMMVTLVVVGVLVAVALPTFLRARERADDRAAQAAATTGLKAQKAQAADGTRLEAASEQPTLITRLTEMERSTRFLSLPAVIDVNSQPKVKGAVYVRLENGGIVKLVSRSTTGRCYWTRENNGAIDYAVSPCDKEPADADFTPKPW